MAGKANPALAAELGLDPATNFGEFKGDTFFATKADGSTWKVGEPEQDWNAYLKDSTSHKVEKGEGKKKTPPPTAPHPHPPELIVDDSKAIAVSTSPDVCRVGNTPTPFMVHGLGSDDENYSPDVFANGVRVKHNQSRIWYTRGDEPGTGLGVKSNTVSSKVIPVSHSSLLRVNGIWAQRHSDTCLLNNGNCPGEYVHVKSTETSKAPDANDEQDKKKVEQDKQKPSDTRGALGKAADGFYDNSSEAQAIGAAFDRLGDYAGDTSLIGQDINSLIDAAPTGAQVLEFGQNVATGAVEGAKYVYNNPTEAATGAVNAGVEGLKGLWGGLTGAYDKGGVMGAGGHLAAAGLSMFNPAKKLKWAGEAVDEIGDLAKTGDKVAGKKAGGLKPETEDGGGGGRVTAPLKGEQIDLKGMKKKKVKYKKRSKEDTKKLRDEFDRGDRKKFVKNLADSDEKIAALKESGFSDVDIAKMKEGLVPEGYQVHHKLPLDDGGTNAFDNLVLIQNDPYHKALTNLQNDLTRGMNPGDVRDLDWPVPDGDIYPLVKE